MVIPSTSTVPWRSGRRARTSGPLFELADEHTDTTERGTDRPLVAVEAEQQHRLAAHERLADQRAQLLGGERPERTELLLGVACDAGDEVDPAQQQLAHA